MIVFWDETGFLMLPTVQRTWAPRGQTPVLWRQLKPQRRVSAIGVISVSPRRRRVGCYRFLWPDDAVDDAVIVALLRPMRRHFRRPILLLWDRLPSHRSAFVKEYLARIPDLEVEDFPAYAPERNPVEALWSDTKQHDLARFRPYDLKELQQAAERALDRKAHDQHRIAGYIREAELPMKLRA